MELWDLYDENRCLLNEIHIRGNIFKENHYHIVVGIWIVNSQGQILITLRHPHKETYPNLWENTGGSVLAGESSVDGARRELKEEIGLSAEKKELKLLGTIKGNHNFVDIYLLKKDIEISDIQLQEEETVDAKWVIPDELFKMIDNGEIAPPIQERFLEFCKRIIPYQNQ
jgi:isopentenyldiphosphate isomerase